MNLQVNLIKTILINFKINRNNFKGITTSQSEFTGRPSEQVTPVRRNTYTKIEGDFYTDTTSKSEYTDHTAHYERTTIVKKRDDNLTSFGQIDFNTTSQVDFIDQDVTYQRPRKRTWTKDDVDKFYSRTDEIQTTTNQELYQNKTAERPTAQRPTDNLKPEGDFDRPGKQGKIKIFFLVKK